MLLARRHRVVDTIAVRTAPVMGHTALRAIESEMNPRLPIWFRSSERSHQVSKELLPTPYCHRSWPLIPSWSKKMSIHVFEAAAGDLRRLERAR